MVRVGNDGDWLTETTEYTLTDDKTFLRCAALSLAQEGFGSDSSVPSK